MLGDEPLARCAVWCNREVARRHRDHEAPGRGLVRLRPADEDDLDLLAGWFGDPSFVDHWGQTPLPRQEVAAKYLGRRRPAVESFIVLAGDVPIGYIQYWFAGNTEGGIDLVLDPRWRGRGYGPDAAGALANHLLRDLGWTRVTADPAATNTRAVRAWEKAGFHRVGQNGGKLVMERRS